MNFQPNRIDRIDLNLLRLFDAIYREGSLQDAAAAALKMSQPTASHALGRLREALGDELFVRTAQGMMPTARAEDMSEPVREALRSLEISLLPQNFDPATERQTFRIAADNSAVVSLTGAIVDAVSRVAPGVSLRIRPSGTIDPEELIDRGELDLFIGRPGEIRERFVSKELVRDNFVVVHRTAMAFARYGSEIEKIARLPHLDISSVGDDTRFVDEHLNLLGLKRVIRHSVPLLGCKALLQRQDLLAVMRRQIAIWLCDGSGLTMAELPFSSPAQSIEMRWHRRFNSQPAHMWLRKVVYDAVQPIT